jgi:hypothetical protein
VSIAGWNDHRRGFPYRLKLVKPAAGGTPAGRGMAFVKYENNRTYVGMAVFDAIGVRLRSVSFTPQKALAAMKS